MYNTYHTNLNDQKTLQALYLRCVQGICVLYLCILHSSKVLTSIELYLAGWTTVPIDKNNVK